MSTTSISIRIESDERPVQHPSFPLSFEGHNIRYAIIGGDPWFAAVDVCNALGLTSPTKSIARLDDDEVQVIDISTLNTIQGIKNQQLSKSPNSSINVISEPGIYGLTFTSRKPEAKRFKRWLKHEVLPTIRKTGSYELPAPQPEIITQEQYGILFQALGNASSHAIHEKSCRNKLVNYLKCTFNVDPLTNLRSNDLLPALDFLKTAKEQVLDIRMVLSELEQEAHKDMVTKGMPSLRHLKGRYRRKLEKKLGTPVNAHQILVHDYLEKNGLSLTEGGV